MNADRDTDLTNLQALIALWQDEEQRLRSIINDPQTSPSTRDRASERLRSVIDQIRAFGDELDALERTDQTVMP
jgi:hypothetical protein